MKEDMVKIVVFVPVENAEKIRETLGELGAGKIGNYDFCSFSSAGKGRFRPLKNSNPAIGRIDVWETVDEERIETVCKKIDLEKIIKEIKKVHPYEEPAIDVYPLALSPEEISEI